MNKQELKDMQRVMAWFDEMESQPGIYDSLAEIGEESTVSAIDRLHEMFLKRLYGHKITLGFYGLQHFGDVRLNGFFFDFETLAMNGFTSKLPFTTDSGVKGMANVDWKNRFLTLIPDGEELSDSLNIYRIGQFQPSGVSVILDFTLDLSFVVDAYPVQDMETDFDVLRKSQEHYQMDDMYIAYALDPMQDRTFALKYIAHSTGIAASTLSDLRNGKKKVKNLTVATASLLSAFGHIKFVDSFIFDALLRLSDKSQEKMTKYERAIPRVVVEMNSGVEYEFRLESESEADSIYNNLEVEMNNEGRMLRLDGVRCGDKVFVKRSVIKDNVVSIYQNYWRETDTIE